MQSRGCGSCRKNSELAHKTRLCARHDKVMAWQTTRRMPPVKAVKAYWAGRLSNKIWRKSDCPYEVVTEDFCFACGAAGVPLERAHIRPHMRDPRNDIPSNIHMLCTWCHCDSEHLSGLPYFRWFKQRKAFEGVNSAVEELLAHLSDDTKELLRRLVRQGG